MKDFLAKYGSVNVTHLWDEAIERRAREIGTHPKDAAWRERVGFDNICTKEDLALDRPVIP